MGCIVWVGALGSGLGGGVLKCRVYHRADLQVVDEGEARLLVVDERGRVLLPRCDSLFDG